MGCYELVPRRRLETLTTVTTVVTLASDQTSSKSLKFP